MLQLIFILDAIKARQSTNHFAALPIIDNATSALTRYSGHCREIALTNLLAINVVRLALEAEEDNSVPSGTARIALDHLEEMAGQLKQKWQEDYASLKEAS